MKALLPLPALVLALAAGCGDEDGDDRSGAGEPAGYTAELRPLNDSGVTGEAAFDLEEDAVRVRISASGFKDDQIIAQWVKGRTDTAPARCPRGDVSASQGRRAYGGTLLALQPFPTIRSGESALRYDLKLSLSAAERRRLEPGEGRVIVLAGRTADRVGDLRSGRPENLPLACGRIVAEYIGRSKGVGAPAGASASAIRPTPVTGCPHAASPHRRGARPARARATRPGRPARSTRRT